MVPINYLAVLASTVIMMVLGGLWYGPIFGRPWIALMGFDPQKVAQMQAKGASAMWKSYALMALGALIMSFVLAHAVIFANAYLGTSGISGGLMVGFLNWLGFIAPVSLGTVLWEGKSWKLWFLNTGYYLVGLLIIGVLLSVWA
jgi:hypothetical protein